jgi:hypothetical protein
MQILESVMSEEQHERGLIEVSKRDTSVLNAPVHCMSWSRIFIRRTI